MPKLHRWAACGASFAALLALASPAQSIPLESYYQDHYVTVYPDKFTYLVDYSLVPDGMPRRWDFGIQSDDPNATLTLGGPNEVMALYERVGPGGTFEVAFSPLPQYYFKEIFRGPGLVSYQVWVERGYDFCDTPGPVGTICSARFDVWGNSKGLILDSDAPMTIHFTSTVIPEPQTWALMILGFGGAGAMLRRRRRLAA